MRKSPAWGMSMADRFEQMNRINQYRVSSQLGYYLGPDKYKEFVKLSFPKAARFKPSRKFDLYNMQPGPGDYHPENSSKLTYLV